MNANTNRQAAEIVIADCAAMVSGGLSIVNLATFESWERANAGRHLHGVRAEVLALLPCDVRALHR